MKQVSKKKNRSKGRGTVALLAMLFIASAGLRLATSATEVVAEARAAFGASADEPDTKDPMPGKTEADLARLLKEFEERETRLRQRERDLEKRMIVLETAEARIDEQIKQLETAEAQLRDTLALASTAAEDDLARLTAVYENMKPKTAAALFEEMDPDFAAGFIARMRPDAAASVLAGMQPQSAYSISTILAGRNANIPEE